MKTYLDLQSWPRREHFEFFGGFDEPFFGIVADVDCTQLLGWSKQNQHSFFLAYLHRTLAAVNACEPFRYRIEDGKIAIYDRVDASATIGRPDDSFGFSFIAFDPDFETFKTNAQLEIERIQNTPGLLTRAFDMANLIHFSALPWVDFTSLSHARKFSLEDSCPKISYGKIKTNAQGRSLMAVSIHVHHALMDGLHVGRFLEVLKQEFNRV